MIDSPRRLLVVAMTTCCLSCDVKAQSSDSEASHDLAAVEVAPEFPGGPEKMYAFLASNQQYPDSAVAHGTQGKVFVRFIVEKDGSLSEMAVAKPVDLYLDEEALRLVHLMPKWKPGRISGQAVRTRLILPFNFKLH